MEPIPLNPRFAQAPGHYLVTDKGVRLRLRLVESSDRAMILDFVARLAPDGLRCHDRSTGARLDGPTLARLLDGPGRGEHALAFDRDTGALAAVVLIAVDPRTQTAVVTTGIAAAWRGRGVRRALLRHAAERAFLCGARSLRTLESRAEDTRSRARFGRGLVPKAAKGQGGHPARETHGD